MENRCWRSRLVGTNDRVHRAVNVGKESFEGVTTFFLDRPEAVPQPVGHEPRPAGGGDVLAWTRRSEATKDRKQSLTSWSICSILQNK